MALPPVRLDVNLRSFSSRAPSTACDAGTTQCVTERDQLPRRQKSVLASNQQHHGRHVSSGLLADYQTRSGGLRVRVVAGVVFHSGVLLYCCESPSAPEEA